MKNQPHYNYPPPQGNYPPGSYPPPPPGGYQGGGFPPPGPPPGKTQVLGLDYNVAALLAYLPICGVNLIASIIWLVSEPKQNRFLRFHALQSLLLIGASFVLGIVFWFLGVILSSLPFGGSIFLLVSLLLWAIGIGLLVVCIIAMVKAFNREIWKIPVIGDIAEKNA